MFGASLTCTSQMSSCLRESSITFSIASSSSSRLMRRFGGMRLFELKYWDFNRPSSSTYVSSEPCCTVSSSCSVGFEAQQNRRRKNEVGGQAQVRCFYLAYPVKVFGGNVHHVYVPVGQARSGAQGRAGFRAKWAAALSLKRHVSGERLHLWRCVLLKVSNFHLLRLCHRTSFPHKTNKNSAVGAKVENVCRISPHCRQPLLYSPTFSSPQGASASPRPPSPSSVFPFGSSRKACRIRRRSRGG